MAKNELLFKRIIAWTILVCVLAAGITLYVHLSLQKRQLDREIIYRKARALAAQEQRQQRMQYQKRFEQQNRRYQYNKGGVVNIPTGN